MGKGGLSDFIVGGTILFCLQCALMKCYTISVTQQAMATSCATVDAYYRVKMACKAI